MSFFRFAARRDAVAEAPAPLTEPSPTGGVDVAISGLSKSFSGHAVLSDLSLFIPAGQFVAIIGRSGCGKSTLLRQIAGLDQPDAGTIRFPEAADQDPRRVARVMFQEPRLLPWARVAANVAVGLGPAGDTPEGRARARQGLAAVGLGDRAEDWPSVLSGGQKQRVALARALAARPQLMALDEPLGALDALTRLEMQQLIESIWRREGFTAILVTHDVGEAVALADRILLIEQGRVVLDQEIAEPRPRRRGSAALAALEESFIRRLLRDPGPAPDYMI